jgi:hypothetical protein
MSTRLCLLVLLLWRLARAGGECEGDQVRYTLTSTAVPAGRLAFEVAVPWCEAGGDEGESKAILVTDLDLGARRWYASPKPRHGATAVKAVVGRDRLEPAAAWPKLAKARGFRPAGQAPARGACQVDAVVLDGPRVVPWAEAEAKDSFVMHKLGARVHGRADAVLEVGTHPQGAEPPKLWVVKLPNGPRLYLETARCEGGPPPGMYGPDDPGTCAAVWSLSFKDLPPTLGCETN